MHNHINKYTNIQGYNKSNLGIYEDTNRHIYETIGIGEYTHTHIQIDTYTNTHIYKCNSCARIHM